MKIRWTGEIIGQNTHEVYENDEPELVRDWMYNQLIDRYGYEDGPTGRQAGIVLSELTSHDFVGCGDWMREVGNDTARICHDWVEDED